MVTRVLLVSSRTDVSEILQDDPGAEAYELERRSHDFVDVEEAAQFDLVLIDFDTTPDGVSLGKSLRAQKRSIEFIPIAGPDRERQAVESLKVGAFDYQVWPPTEPSDFWTLIARAIRKLHPVEEPQFPRPFGRFTLLRRLGAGGMAEVFLAETQATVSQPARPMVVKQMLQNLAAGEEFVRMFMDECKISILLVHPNIVRVADFGRQGETLYLTMEYVPGRNLEELLRDVAGPFPPGLACWIVAEICAGLGHAHRKADRNGAALNIVHRDVNPPNVLLSDDGRVMITDFGIAKATGRYYETTSGVLKGKFEYMSPEQAHGQPIDARADLFSAGLILYELLSGSRAFVSTTPIETLFLIQQCRPDPPSVHNARLPKDLDAMALKALARDPAHRYQTAEAMEKDLRAWAQRNSQPGANDLAAFLRTNAPEDHTEKTGDFEIHFEHPAQPPEPPKASAPPAPPRAPPVARAAVATAAPIPRAPPPAPASMLSTVPMDPSTETPSMSSLRAKVTMLGPADTTTPQGRLLDADRPSQTEESMPDTTPMGRLLDDRSSVTAGSAMQPTNPQIADPSAFQELDPEALEALDGPVVIGELVLAGAETVIRSIPLQTEPRPVVRPEPSRGTEGIFPASARNLDRRRRILQAGAAAGVVLAVGGSAFLVSTWIGPKEIAKPAYTSLVVATPAQTPSSGAPTPTAVVVVTTAPRATPTATPTQVAVSTTARPIATPTAGAAATPTPAVVATVKTSAAKGTLSVWVDGWATVEIDGKPAGVSAPFVGFALTEGKHSLILQNQWTRKEQWVVITAGKETKVAVDLR